MKHPIHITVLLLALTLVPALQAQAFEEVTGSFTGGVEYFADDEDNAKFNEYRYKHMEEYGGFVDADFTWAPLDKPYRIDFDFHYRSPEDIDVGLGSMSYGLYKFYAEYQRMGHNFAFDVKSLYSGNGTGVLRIPDAQQLAIETSPDAATTAALLRGFVASAGTEDIYLRRDRVKTGLEWVSLDPVRFKLDFDYENRTGSRPFGGNFSFNNAVEIFEPISYDTYNLGADVEYAGKWLYANASYRHSTFDNGIQSVLYDNPLASPTNGLGLPFEGQNAMPPSNYYNSVTGTAAVELPLHSRLTANVSYGWMRQDEKLLAATVNPALVTLPLPRATADASVNTSMYEAILTSRPLDKLHLKFAGKYYKHENTTPVQPIDWVRSDVQLNGLISPIYVDWIARTLEAEATYEIFKRTNLGFAYEYESESFRNGSSNSERINTYKVTLDSHMYDWLSKRLTLEYSNRNAAYPDYTAANSEIPWNRKYYAADRDRYQASLMETIMPTDNLSVVLEYMFGYDDYDDTRVGLRDTRDHTASVDVSYNPVEMLSLNAYYAYENHRSNQASRQWSIGGTGDPYGAEPFPDPSFSNWFLELMDEAHTVGLGADLAITDRLGFKVDGVFAFVDGDADFDSGVGAPDNNAYVPQDFDELDETTWWKVSASARYAFTKSISMTLGYIFESWRIDDYNYDGLTEVLVDGAGAYRGLLNMNTLYKDYDVHTVYLAATYAF